MIKIFSSIGKYNNLSYLNLNGNPVKDIKDMAEKFESLTMSNREVLTSVPVGKEFEKVCRINAYKSDKVSAEPFSEEDLYSKQAVYWDFWEYVNPEFCESNQSVKANCLLGIASQISRSVQQ